MAEGIVTAIGADHSVNLLNEVAGGSLTHRQCNIQIKNLCTSHTLTNPRMYVSSGSSSVALPHDVGPKMETAVEFIKTPYTTRGAVGVFTYDVKDSRKTSADKRLALMFSVPFNFTFHKNWFAAGFFSASKACDYELFREMYYDNENKFVRRRAEQYITHKEQKYTVKASMTNSFTPVMVVEIYDS